MMFLCRGNLLPAAPFFRILSIVANTVNFYSRRRMAPIAHRDSNQVILARIFNM
jgi:hypothetical protein